MAELLCVPYQQLQALTPNPCSPALRPCGPPRLTRRAGQVACRAGAPPPAAPPPVRRGRALLQRVAEVAHQRLHAAPAALSAIGAGGTQHVQPLQSPDQAGVHRRRPMQQLRPQQRSNVSHTGLARPNGGANGALLQMPCMGFLRTHVSLVFFTIFRIICLNLDLIFGFMY